MFNTVKLKKSIAAVLTAATLFSASGVASAGHFLSSAQEKEIGNEAVAEFKREHKTYRSQLLDLIQDRLIEFNPDQLWYYGKKAGSKRGLEPVLMAEVKSVNAFSYPGGQVFVYDRMLDLYASKNEDGTLDGPKNPWNTSQIYQMSALAATMGHEFAHWAHEDFLREYDKQMGTRIVASLIPAGNVWAMLGIAAGSSVINALNSRQMGFRTEQQADEAGMLYVENVPEYSIGGEAIDQYRTLLRELRRKSNAGGMEDWLHPHSKTDVRLKRALDYQRISSNGFIEWRDAELYINGGRVDYLYGRDDVTRVDRTMYVIGQIATAIKYGIASEQNLRLYSGDEVFTGGNKNETYALIEGTDKNGNRRVKILDKYTVPKNKMETLLQYTNSYDTFRKKCNELGVSENEVINFTYSRKIIRTFRENRIKYSKPIETKDDQSETDSE